MNTTIKHKLQLLGMAKTWGLANLAGWSDDAHRDLIARHGAVALPKDAVHAIRREGLGHFLPATERPPVGGQKLAVDSRQLNLEV